MARRGAEGVLTLGRFFGYLDFLFLPSVPLYPRMCSQKLEENGISSSKAVVHDREG